MIRKVVAFVVAYGCFASSVWSLALPVEGLAMPRPVYWVNWGAPRTPLSSFARSAGVSSAHATAGPARGNDLAALLADLNAPADDDQAPSNCTVHSTQPSGDDGENQDQRRDEHRSYQHHNYTYGSDDHSQGSPTPIVPTGVTIFGPQTYTRTTGPTDDFTSTITVPAWDAQPFFLHVVNGDTSGNHRVSSATVRMNGATIIGESVFNQNVASIDCAIQLTAQSTLQVDLDSKPGSFLTINVLGKSLDHTPPVVTIVSPAPAINTSQPHLDIRYQDLVGAGETVASGVNTTTLRVLLDGVDRTSLFTRRSDEATADVPASLALAPGSHTITASIQDNAENLGQATEQFQVNTAAPVLQILQPASGSYLNTTTPQIVLAYSSALGLNLASLKVTDNGTDITAAFNKTATGASGTAPPLSQGGNTIVASISDQAGNQTTTSLVFNVDTTPPTITIVQPAPGSDHGSSSVQYLIQYSDDQAIDPSTLVVSVDGNPLAVTPTLSSASGTVTLGDGASHTITASIKDKAGNPSTTASSTFSVDTSLPNVHIVQPASNAVLNNATPPFQVTYSESASGVDTGTFKATVDGIDVTGLFTVGAASASATLHTPLADGSHTFFAQIASTVGNVGHDTNQVLIDTIKPQVTIVSPPGIVNTTTPGAVVQYSDSGSGIDPTSVHVTLDGVDVTGSFGVSSSSATGTLGSGTGLTEGSHQFAVAVADKAGNVAQPSVSFLVDVTAPVAAFSAPANDSFINNPQPTITLTYSDSVSGVDQGSIHIFLQQGTAAETEITSLFTFSAGQATATIPASAPLTPGTYHLRATVADRAGNQSPVNAAFVLDTVAPTYTIQTPAANAFLNTSTPTFTVVYQDDSSGVDVSKFALRVDGIDRTSRLTVTDTGASGTLQASDALPDGTHQVEVTVVDRAGNSAPIVPQSFLVDTVPPVITIGTPLAASFTNNNHPSISVAYSDTGSGIDVTTLQVLIDGIDHTAEFTATATGATGSPAAALLDGTHTISASIKDLAGNQSSPAATGFTIDTVRPVITATAAPPANAAGWNITDVTVSFVCSDNASGVVSCPPPQVVTAEGRGQVITGTVSDVAGNQATASVTLNIEKSAPTITASLSPAANAGGWNNSDVTVSFQCSSVSDIVSCQPPVTISTEGKNQQVSGTVTDQAGKTATTSVPVNLDKTPPLITANAAPPSNPAGWNNTDVVVTYTCSDALSGIAQCPPPATVSTEGAKQNIVAQATDQAGNTTPVSTVLSIDKTPPTITVTATPSPNGAGWNNSKVTVNFSCVDNLSGVASCPGQQTVASEGQNQNISGQATDVAGNTATGSISLSIDKTPPTIVQISTPDHISQLHSGQVSVSVNDNFTVAQVVISVNGTSLGTFTTPPYQATLQVPAGVNPGDTLTVTVVATDQAGNSQTASRGVSVAADGVIVGQVLSDVTGSPVQGASVQVISAGGQTDTTDDRGRYSFQASDSHVFLSATNSGSTTVQREIFVQPGAGTVAVDARTTPLAPAISVSSLGGTLKAGPISVFVPAASVPDGSSFQLTPLSGQGLPGLLPLGWSPLAAFDLRGPSSASNLTTAISGLPNVVAHLVTYDSSLHAWTLVEPNLQPANGTASFTLPTTGAYALAVPDTTDPPITIPNVGAALTGVQVQVLDPSATSGGTLNPAVLPPGGGTATATLGVQSPTYVPSGTVIQANVSEKFSLASGDVVSEQTRSEDIVLYNALAPANATMGALFPVTPSHQYTNTQLLTGKVHLDILAGREGVRGQPGGNDPLTLSDGIATISVPGGALGQDTAIAVQTISLEDFVPTSTTSSALQEVLVDFSGEILNTPAQLSMPATGLDPTHTFLLTQVQRINGVPHIVAVAVAQINGGNLTSVATPGLPGVINGGEYVFYDLSAPSGFVQGTVSSTAGAVQALVQTDSLPITSITGTNGRYIVPALAGAVNLKANALNSSLSGTATVQLTAGQTVPVDILLVGSVNTAVVSPADGSLGVPTSTIITVTAPVPISPGSINRNNLVLFKGTPSSPGAPVPLQPFVLSVSGSTLTFAPLNNLDAAAQYTVQVGGLADGGGGAIVVPTSTFTTKAAASLNFDPNQVTFAFPDASGSIHVSAPAGALPPGTKVTIVDQTTAVVLSLTALNDGSLSGDFPGTINDVLQVSVTDPNGATASFTRSQFVAADGSVAVGPGGGTVTGPGGVELRIPTGALDQGAVFKIASFGPDLFAERPDMPGGNFGGGLRITSSKQVLFNKEVKLAFPVPADAPPGAFFQVYRKLPGPNNQFAFEDLDFAQVEGQGATAKVVTASFPFRGLIDLNNLLTQAAFLSQVLGEQYGGEGAAVFQAGLDNIILCMWTVENSLPGISLGGAITGRVRYPVPAGGTMPDGTINKTGDTVFVGVANSLVTVDTNTSTHALGTGVTLAVTQPDGTFTFSDPNYRGGTIHLIASDGAGHAVTASAIEVVALTDKTVNDFAGPMLKFYRNVAFADIVVPAPAPPPPTPQIGINLFTEDPTTHLRQPVNGLVASGTSLVVAFKTNGQISNPPTVKINNTTYPTQTDQSTAPGDPNQMDFELSQSFVPGPLGIYTITATGITPFLKTITASKSFFVVGAGGSNNTIKVGTPPIIAAVTPQAGSIGVPVNTFVQVQFSEPVTNLPGHVSLVPDDGSTPPLLKLSGIDYHDGVTVISNLAATDAVASMTIEPSELKYGTHYTLQITSDVVDLDNVADPTKPALALVQPQDQNPPQAPFDFTTFGPSVIGGTSGFSSTRAVVFGNRAYVGVPQPNVFSQLNTYDLTDPTHPVPLPDASTTFAGRPMDLAGEQNAAVINNGTLLAVGSGFATSTFLMPSNLWLYDVTTDQINRVAGISVTSSAVNVGQILRVTLHGNFAYTSTYPVGINVVDLQQGITEYQNALNTDVRSFSGPILTDGQGFANDAVVNTIPVQDPTKNNNPNVMLLGIQAGDFLVAGSDPQNPTTQTLVVATGAAPGPQTANQVSFVVADPTQPSSSALLYSGPLQLGNFGLNRGVALALGQINIPDTSGNPVPHPVAVVVGNGSAIDPANNLQTTPFVMAVVDMTIPAAPKVLSVQGVSSTPSDVVMKDNFAIVGEATQTEIFDLTDPGNPFLAGTINGIGGTLSLNGFLYSTSFSGTGLQVAALGALAFVTSFNPSIIRVTASDETLTDVAINYAILPPDPHVTQAEIHIDVKGGGRAATLPGTLSKGKGSVVWPAGTLVDNVNPYVATVHVQENGAELPTIETRLPLVKIPVAIRSRDRMLKIQFALPDQKLFVDSNNQPLDTFTIKVFLGGSSTESIKVTSDQIIQAYDNTDVWFDDLSDSNPKTALTWVARKIDTFAEAAGLPNPIRMQAYELGTILTASTSVLVEVVGEKNGKLYRQKFTATQTADGNWSEVIDKVMELTNSTPTPVADPSTPALQQNAGLAYRVLQALDIRNVTSEFFKGVWEGIKFGFNSDVDLIKHPGKILTGLLDLLTLPWHIAKFLWRIAVALVDAVRHPTDSINSLKSFVNSLRQLLGLAPALLDYTPMLINLTVEAYGFVNGFVLYMLAQAAVAALVGAGIGAIADAAVQALTKGVEIAGMVVDAEKVLNFFITVVRAISTIFGDATALENALNFIIHNIPRIMKAIDTVYQFSEPVLNGIGRLFAKLTPDILTKLFDWLVSIQKMGDAAAVEFLRFVENSAADGSKLQAAVTRWLAFADGSRGIKDIFTAFQKAADLQEGAREGAVIAASFTDASAQVMAKFVPKYGDKAAEQVLLGLKATVDDGTFTNNTIGKTAQILVDDRVPVASADSARGMAWTVQKECLGQ